jgi:hypothetical protein
MAPAMGYLIPECDLAGANPYGVTYVSVSLDWSCEVGHTGSPGGLDLWGGDGVSPPSDFDSKMLVQGKRGFEDTSGASDFHADECFDCDV